MNAQNTLTGPALVTGATGFIGSRVVQKLLQDGVAVRALLLPHEPLPDGWMGRVDVARGSISDRSAVEKAMEGARTVIHLAAIVSDWGDEKWYWEVTVEGSRLVFEQALANGARVVLVSSIAVYGDNIHTRACPEETGYGKTFGPYSRTKQAQEKLAWEFYEKGMRLSVVRPANVYGPGSGPWLHDVIKVLQSGSPGLISGGRMNAGLAYVDNVADIVILAGSVDAAIGRAYNACDGSDVTWATYFSDISRIIGKGTPKSIPRPVAVCGAFACEAVWRLLGIRNRPPITREALNLVGSDNRIPAGRVQRDLHYEPRVSYAEGLSRTREYVEREYPRRKGRGPAFAGKLAFVTGGSSGIGLETARLLSSLGCSLVLLARDRTRLDEACSSIKACAVSPSQGVDAMSMDVADDADVRQKIKSAVDLFGAPDILINSAGVGSGDYFENISIEQFDRIMKINVYGTRNTISAILPFMKQKGRGHIVNISSMAGLIGMFGYSLYGTTKYALVGLSECLRSELKRYDIAVTLICPPEVRTPFIEEEARTLPPESRAVKDLAGSLQPKDVAEAVVRGIQKNKFLVVPGFAARFLYLSHRISNGLLTRAPSDWIVRFAARKPGKG